MLNDIYSSVHQRMQKSMEGLQKEFRNFRSGKANPAMLDGIKIDYYGTPTPLNQVAKISVPENRLIVIQPFDKSVIGTIEKEIQKSDLGIHPQNDGKVVRLSLPQMTEDQRKQLAKLAHTKAEDFRVAIRNIRREGNEEVEKIKKDGHISEDELKKGHEEIQKVTNDFIAKIDEMLKIKEKEIFTV
jgi:ribosome recycling factor